MLTTDQTVCLHYIIFGRYHLPVLWPPFFANLTPNDPIFLYSPHPMTPFFQNFNVKFQIFRSFSKLSISSWKRPMTPYFGKFTPKKRPNYLDPTPNDPLFATKSYTKCPLFSFFDRHIPVTFIFESPPPIQHTFMQCLMIKFKL